MALPEGNAGLAMARLIVPRDLDAQIHEAIERWTKKRAMKVSDLYPGWAQVENKGQVGEAFCRRVNGLDFPLTVLEGEDANNHKRYVRRG